MSCFQIPTRKCDTDWRNDIVKVLGKYREVDMSLRERIANGNVYICERHFKPDDIELTKSGRKTLRLGAVPSLNLPVKSHETPIAYRRKLDVVCSKPEVKTVCYKHWNDFLARTTKSKKTNNWQLCNINNDTKLISNILRNHSLCRSMKLL